MKLSPSFLRKALNSPVGASLKTRAMLLMLGVGLSGVGLASLISSHHEDSMGADQVLGMALQALLLVLVVGLVFLLLLEHTLLRPLRRLAEQAHAFDPTQPPPCWLDKKGSAPRELQQINQAFERVQQSMGAQLRREQSRAEQLRVEVEQRSQALEQARLALEAAKRELASLSRHDALTGLANRREFDDALRREFKRAQRQQGLLALAVLDLDSFRAYNEALGRESGDGALQQVAGLLSERFKRDTDLVARLGGEEFGVLLPGCDRDQAQDLLEQLREALSALAIRHPAGTQLSLSIGLAVYRPAQTYLSPQALLQAADEALYVAKHAGRDRLSLAA
jgi:diguanylate cyclase (GGDEF)-like protein